MHHIGCSCERSTTSSFPFCSLLVCRGASNLWPMPTPCPRYVVTSSLMLLILTSTSSAMAVHRRSEPDISFRPHLCTLQTLCVILVYAKTCHLQHPESDHKQLMRSHLKFLPGSMYTHNLPDGEVFMTPRCQVTTWIWWLISRPAPVSKAQQTVCCLCRVKSMDGTRCCV